MPRFVGSGFRNALVHTVWATLGSLLVGATVFASPSFADPAPELEQAVAAVRSATSCTPLQRDPRVEHAAEIVNRSTLNYLNHTADTVPADEPHPTAILTDLGINPGKVLSLMGAGQSEAGAIKGLLLEGRDAIPDCSYTGFGASRLYEPESGNNLVTVLLVGQ